MRTGKAEELVAPLVGLFEDDFLAKTLLNISANQELFADLPSISNSPNGIPGLGLFIN